MSERDYYPLLKRALELLLQESHGEYHFEITANKRFSNKLKAQVGGHRDIIFHFLRDAAPDLSGFIKGEYSTEFIIVEFKSRALKLDDVYQARKYAELFDARYAVLASTEEVPEELKRLSRVNYSLLALPAYKSLALARFDERNQTFADWFQRNPFEKDA